MRFSIFSKNQHVEEFAAGPPAAATTQDAFNGNLLLIGVAAFTVIGFFLVNLAVSPTDLAASFSIDDSFYYYETAWQTKLNGFVTFDSLHPANGVHFLWFMVVLAIAFLCPSKIALLYAVYGISLVLVAGVYAAIWRVGTLMDDRRRYLTLMMTLIWSVILIDRQHLMVSGMESTIHMAVLWAGLIAALTALRDSAATGIFPGRWHLLFTVSMVLVTWTRLDAALFSLALFSYVTISVIRNTGTLNTYTLRYILFSFAIIIVGAAIQIGFFYLAGGTVIPISALVKATGIGPEITAGPWSRHLSVIFPFATFIQQDNPLHLAVEGVFFIALLSYTLTRAFRSEPPLRFLHGIATALGATIPVYAAIVGSNHDPFWRWYLSPVFLFYCLGIACAFYEASGALNARFLCSRLMAGGACAIVSLAFLFVQTLTHRPIPLYLTRAQVGQFLKQTTETGDIFASFNSGQLGFLSERRMINLDGLVNSYDYFSNVFNKPKNIMAYLRKNNVRYIIDYNFYWATKEILENTVPKYAFEMQNDYKQRTLYVRELTGR